jgi:hypothetical protein
MPMLLGEDEEHRWSKALKTDALSPGARVRRVVSEHETVVERPCYTRVVARVFSGSDNGAERLVAI